MLPLDLFPTPHKQRTFVSIARLSLRTKILLDMRMRMVLLRVSDVDGTTGRSYSSDGHG